MLSADVQERGIQVYFDNEVSTVFEAEEPRTLEVTLKSGKVLETNAIVYAIGTRPNIEIARIAGLTMGRGIKVNEFLQTSDPNIFALGEIAEFRNQTYGNTAAAEEQADILANYIAGDISSSYEGSILMNILKFDDLDLCSIGNIFVPNDDLSYEEVIFMDVAKRYYKKCIIKDDLLIGAVLMGDKKNSQNLKT